MHTLKGLLPQRHTILQRLFTVVMSSRLKPIQAIRGLAPGALRHSLPTPPERILDGGRRLRTAAVPA